MKIADVINMDFSEDDRILFESAQKNAHSGDIQAAIEQLNDLTIKNPKNGIIHAVLALRYGEAGLLDQAEVEYRKSVALYPRNEHCSLGLFHFLWEQDKQVEALDEMKRYLSIAKSTEYDEILKGINKALID
jgi:tetratricopeptide (TPR) repeat protein